MSDNATTDAPETAVRWLIPILPAADAVLGISHAFELERGKPAPEDYKEPICGISTFIDQHCRESTANRCPTCVVKLSERQQQ